MEKVFDYLGTIFRVILAVFLFVLSQLIVFYLFKFSGVDTTQYEGVYTTVYALIIAVVFMIYILVRSYKRDPLVRFQRTDGFNCLIALVIAFGLLGMVTLYTIGVQQISEYIEPVAEDMERYNDSLDRFSDVDKAVVPYWDIVLDFISTGIMIPFLEELVFRGVIYGELRTRFNIVVSIAVSSIIFGCLHGITVHVGYALVCGAVLALVYEYSRSIWVSFTVHMFFNIFGSMLFVLLDSGIFGDMSLITYDMSLFFVVAEYLCIIPAVAGILLLRVFYKQRINGSEAMA